VLIVRRDPDGSFESAVFDTIAGDCSAETGAELMWRAREAAEQQEAEAITAHNAGAASVRAGGDARDRRIEAEGLAAAMRDVARSGRPSTSR
jgi:hypothetical protein